MLIEGHGFREKNLGALRVSTSQGRMKKYERDVSKVKVKFFNYYS